MELPDDGNDKAEVIYDQRSNNGRPTESTEDKLEEFGKAAEE